MYESLYSQWKPIFRETFNSEQDCRRNGWVPTNVTFSNWVWSFNGISSKILYNARPIPSTRSFTICWTINPTTVSWNQIVVEQFIYTSWWFQISISSWKLFFNVIKNSTDIFVWANISIWKIRFCCVWTWTVINVYINWVLWWTTNYSATLPATSTNIYIWMRQINDLFFSWAQDIIEFYNYAWTASQVANDYNNSTYKDIRNWLILDIDSRQWVIEDKIGNTITNTGVTVKKIWNWYSQYYNGTSSFLDLWNSTKFQLQTFTISWWVRVEKLSAIAPIKRHYLFTKMSATVWRWYNIRVNDNLAISFSLYKSWVFQSVWSTSANVISLGKWHHIAWTVTSWSQKTYVNWVELWSATISWPFDVSTANLVVWKWFNSDTADNFAQWNSEQLRIYNRVLSQNEITQLYTSQLPYYK